MRVRNRIRGMVGKAKKAYDDMIRTDTFNPDHLDAIFSALADVEIPIGQTKHRVPGTVPIYVFNLCFYHDNYYRTNYTCTNGRIPVYQTSGTLFPNHIEPQYEVTEIFVSEGIVKMAALEKTVTTVKRDQNPVYPSGVALKKIPSIEKRKFPDGVETERVHVTILELVEDIPPYRFRSPNQKFMTPSRVSRMKTTAE